MCVSGNTAPIARNSSFTITLLHVATVTSAFGRSAPRSRQNTLTLPSVSRSIFTQAIHAMHCIRHHFIRISLQTSQRSHIALNRRKQGRQWRKTEVSTFFLIEYRKHDDCQRVRSKVRRKVLIPVLDTSFAFSTRTHISNPKLKSQIANWSLITNDHDGQATFIIHSTQAIEASI